MTDEAKAEVEARRAAGALQIAKYSFTRGSRDTPTPYDQKCITKGYDYYAPNG
jgi:hypothetical protein